MQEIEELFRKLRHHYRLFLKGSNDSFIKMNEIETALLSKFRELEDYKAAFIVLWDFCKEQTHKQIELEQRAEQAEEQVENAKKEKDEAVKDVRIQYDSVVEMYDRKISELEKEEEKQRLKKEYYHEEHAKELIKRVELEKENEKLKVCRSCGEVLPRECATCYRLWES